MRRRKWRRRRRRSATLKQAAPGTHTLQVTVERLGAKARLHRAVHVWPGDLTQKGGPGTPSPLTPNPYRHWQAQAVLSWHKGVASYASQTHPSKQWEGRRLQAGGGFSQLIILGKARYKFHGWNARVVKCRRSPKEGQGLSFPEGSGRRAGRRVGEEQVTQRARLSGKQEISPKKQRNPLALS